MEAFNCELYNIFTDDNGDKFIHLLAYIYKSFDDESWKISEGMGIVIPIEEFIDEVKKDEEGEYINLLWQNADQRDIEDLTEEDVIRYIDDVNDLLDYNEITVDTPDGDYLKRWV